MLFHGKTFTNASDQARPAFQHVWTARGLAVGDFDNDGASDILINNNGGAPLLLRNNVGRLSYWLGIHLIGTRSNIDAVGARVTWSFAGTTRSRLKTDGGSFLASHDPRIILGIGNAKKIDWLEVKWPLPSHRVDRATDLPLNRYITVVEGKGIQK